MSGLRQRKAPVEAKRSLPSNNAVKPSAIVENSWFTKCFVGLLFCVFATLVTSLVGYYNAPFTSLPLKDFSVQVEMTGSLRPNRRLSQGSKIFGLTGPESIVEDNNGNLYASVMDGRIVKIASSSSGQIGAGKITNVTSGVMPSVPNSFKDQDRGRPLGLRLIKNSLFVADAGYGIYKVGLKTGNVDMILSIKDVNPPMGFTNDVLVTKDGSFMYFSDSSSKYQLSSLLFMFSEGVCDGRVLQYNVKTKETRLVASELCFANGIELSSDEKYLFVLETFRYRIRIIDLSTWKTTRFVDVPVMPDNIRPTGHGTYWIAGGVPWTRLFGFMERNPVMRQIVAGLLGHGGMMRTLDLSYNMLIEMNDNGDIVQSLHDPNGELTLGLSQATLLSDGRLALGSHIAPFLSILDEKNVALGSQNI